MSLDVVQVRRRFQSVDVPILFVSDSFDRYLVWYLAWLVLCVWIDTSQQYLRRRAERDHTIQECHTGHSFTACRMYEWPNLHRIPIPHNRRTKFQQRHIPGVVWLEQFVFGHLLYRSDCRRCHCDSGHHPMETENVRMASVSLLLLPGTETKRQGAEKEAPNNHHYEKRQRQRLARVCVMCVFIIIKKNMFVSVLSLGGCAETRDD